MCIQIKQTKAVHIGIVIVVAIVIVIVIIFIIIRIIIIISYQCVSPCFLCWKMDMGQEPVVHILITELECVKF